MQILTNIAAPVLVAACFVAAAYLLGKVIGKYQQQDLWRDHMEKCDRYARAVDDLDVWCGHQSPHARLISRHLKAMGEGLAHNAGTPTGEEACTIPGLRVQLGRLDETLRSKNNGSTRDASAKETAGWLEAAIAWEVCASLHRKFCKGKDALFSTRQADYVRHAEDSRKKAQERPDADEIAVENYKAKWDAELGRTAMKFVDRAGDVHPGIDDADAICAEFYKAMCEVLERMPHIQKMSSRTEH